MGSLVGNDFVPVRMLADFHRALLPGRHAAGAQLIEAVSRHVATAAAAVGWCGPRPSTPLLWAALDWQGQLSTTARGLVEQSLDQYAIGEGFAELPTALIERAAAASTAMLRRFRRGHLDSSVFTSATRQAIWRGPSIDDPDAAPTILASRPIRCETYSACCPPAHTGAVHLRGDGDCMKSVATGSRDVGDHDHEDANVAEQHSNSACAAAADTSAQSGVFIAEHIIYSTQREAGAPESVPVPPQLMSCEAMWALAPAARCVCMLRALGRAFRDDRTVAAFDAAAIISLGPLALTLLAVRFLRRHGLVPRVAALVMLCQGLVMGWLAVTRQRLPDNLRKRPHRHGAGGAFMLQTAHLASLFTRVTTDLAVLNSACGEPLALHGPWEWFDGVLFESMLFTAVNASANSKNDYSPTGCWAALLRGDAKLLRVLDALRTVALATEAEMDESAISRHKDRGRSSGAKDVEAAAAAWKDSTAGG